MLISQVSKLGRVGVRVISSVGRATIIALLSALALYLMVSLFALGVMSQPEVAALKNPSTAAILETIVGPWGAWLINGGMMISVCGAFLSWTLLACEVPFIAARTDCFRPGLPPRTVMGRRTMRSGPPP